MDDIKPTVSTETCVGVGDPEAISNSDTRSKVHFSLLAAVGVQNSVTCAPIAIGTYLSLAIGLVGSPAYFWGFFMVGFFQFAMCLATAELASAIPHSSGPAYWAAFLASPKYARSLGYVMGWLTNAAWYFLAVFAVNGTAVYLFVGLLVRAYPKQSAHFVFVEFVNESGWSSNGTVFFLALLPAVGCLSAFDNATHLTDELENPKKQVPLVLLISFAMSYLTGLPMIMVYQFCNVSPESLLAAPGGQPLIQLMQNAFRSFPMTAFGTAMIIFCFFTAGASALISWSRLYWSFSREGALPFSGTMSKLSSRDALPINALCWNTFLIVVLGTISIGSTTAMNALLGAANICTLSAFAIEALVPPQCWLKHEEDLIHVLCARSREIGIGHVKQSIYDYSFVQFPKFATYHLSVDLGTAIRVPREGMYGVLMSAGIGAAIAIELARRGASVLVTYVSSAKGAEQIAAEVELQGSGVKGYVLQADCSKAMESSLKIADETKARFPEGVDIIVNNAADGSDISLSEVTVENLDQTFHANVLFPLLLLQNIRPQLRKKIRVVNVSSTSARRAYPTAMTYAASKAALESITRSLAHELEVLIMEKGRELEGTINAVNPGPVNTDMWNGTDGVDAVAEAVMRVTPAGHRIGETNDIAPIVAFLCEEESRWISGSVTCANGGYLTV
ncbi:hypothetical protein NLG97_g2166 [Lecanicillium saksenae]|uniref:Uncharacterized protein n=1 Tax=Lecanicillium saksenae TaxID=468837 RepID=A0ACC1R3I9_9HYPO|nr:hypothetical protein NLG97_g2166 [Lecanicillium saksenae]